MRSSMGAVGNAYDNALAERVNGILINFGKVKNTPLFPYHFYILALERYNKQLTY